MTVPPEYLGASKEFETLLLDIRDTCKLSSVNQAYHTLRAVLHVFRAHVSVPDALALAGVLPAVPRAIFVEGGAARDARALSAARCTDARRTTASRLTDQPRVSLLRPPAP